MNRLTRILGVSLFCAGGSHVVLPSYGNADIACEKIEARQTVLVDLSTFTTTGTIRGDLRGTTQFTGDVTSLVPIAGTVLRPLNPTNAYTGTLVITTRKGTLMSRSVGIFELIPFGTGTQFDRVIAGTEEFHGVTGLLYFTFTANGDLSGFSSIVTGALCREKSKDD
jgi:hypothetical protein